MPNLPDLDDFVERAGARPFAWGGADCSLFVADWITLATGIDPAAGWRGTYATEGQARFALRASGGFVKAISCEMDRHGFRRTSDPLPGDVAIVDVPIAIRHGRPLHRPVAALRLGRLWAVKSRLGLAASAFPVHAAWRIEVIH